MVINIETSQVVTLIDFMQLGVTIRSNQLRFSFMF